MLHNLIQLDTLPRDVASCVSSFFYLRDLARLSRVSISAKALYNRPLLAAKLLHHAKNVDYQRVREIINIDPTLMFYHVRHELVNDKSELISPLKFAFKVYDSYLWQIFLNTIRHSPEWVSVFLKQANEQTEHQDLTCLLEGYDKFDSMYHASGEWWVRLEALTKRWFEIGIAQRDILPRHLLRSMFMATRWGDLYRTAPGVSERKYTPSCGCDQHIDMYCQHSLEWLSLKNKYCNDNKYYSYVRKQLKNPENTLERERERTNFSEFMEPLFPLSDDKGLGIDVTLVRGTCQFVRGGRIPHHGCLRDYVSNLKWDYESLIYLYKEKELELIAQISELEQSVYLESTFEHCKMKAPALTRNWVTGK